MKNTEKSPIMSKRGIALLAAAVIPMTMLLAGCGAMFAESPVVEVTSVEFAPAGAQLTAAEYYDEMKTVYSDYVVAAAAIPLDEESVAVDKMKPNWEKAHESCQKCQELLDRFAVINPPEEYIEKHKDLLTGVNNEKDFVAAEERFLTAVSNKDLKKYGSELDALVERPYEETLPYMWGELMKEVKAALPEEKEQI